MSFIFIAINVIIIIISDFYMNNFINFVNFLDDNDIDQEMNRRGLGHRLDLYNDRFDPFTLNDDAFYKNYRFCEPSARRLVNLLYPDRENETRRGLPFTPTQVLNFLHFISNIYFFLYICWV